MLTVTVKKIFFVIPVYKVEDYLERCVNSILNQTYQAIEIILVDDGSPDNCPAICDELAGKYDNIVVIRKKNGGLSDARNAGIRYVRDVAGDEDYITFVDSDDYVHKDYAKTMIDLCETNMCEAAQSAYEKGTNDTFSVKNPPKNIQIMSSYDALLGYRIKSSSCAKIYKAKLFDDIFYPVGKINEDEFVTYRAFFDAHRVAFTDEKLYYYYQHSTSIMDNVAKKLKNNPHRYDFLEAYDLRMKFFEQKNMPEQVLKTKEKICTDMILRYCEQMYLKKEERDTDCVNGKYMKIYRENFRPMIKRRGISIKKKLMYYAFYIMPYSGVVMGKIFGLRK